MTVNPKDDLGNVQVDFVWGNFPLQPDELRDTPLDPTLDNHSIATTGYSNYPSFIPNYAGDGDTDPEFVVPDVLRKTLNQAADLIEAAGGSFLPVDHYLTASYVESTGKTVRVTAYDTEFANWSNTSGAALVGLKVGDELDLSALTDDQVISTNLGLGVVKVTKVNNDGSNSWFEFKSATELALDTAAAGTVYAGPNLVEIVTVVRPNTGPGTIQNEGRNINVRFIGTI